MIAGVLSYLDVALLAVVAISGLVAMYRGFTREVLSILSWVVAGLALLYFIRSHRALAEEVARQFSSPVQTVHVYIAQVALGAIIFLFVLIVVHLITSHISDTVLDSRVGAIDRILGLVFGVVRGFVLVVIPYMFVVSFVCKEGATRALSQGCQPASFPAGSRRRDRWDDQPNQRDALWYPLALRALRASGEQQQGQFAMFTPTPSPHPMAIRCNLAYIQVSSARRVA